MGIRGVKYTPEQIAKAKQIMLDHISSTPGGTFRCGAMKAKVCAPTAYDWMKVDPQFAKDIAEARAKADELGGDLAEKRLTEAIDNRELTAILFYLKTKHKKRGFSEKDPEEKPKDDNTQALTRLADVLSGLAIGKSTGATASG